MTTKASSVQLMEANRVDRLAKPTSVNTAAAIISGAFSGARI